MIADATFLRCRHRNMILKLAARLGVRPVILNCTAPMTTLKARVLRRVTEQNDASDANLEVLQQQLVDYDELDEQERQFVIPVATDEVTDQSIKNLVNDIARC